MTSKLDGNGLWHTRMMLPEHVVAINEHRRDLNVKEKPLLSADAWDSIQRSIAESYENGVEITLILFDKYEDLRVIGVVNRVDTIGRKIRVDGEWFRVSDVIGVG